MANKFYAATRIKHGSRTEDGSQDGKYESKVFEPGDEVTGLSKEDMKGLWNAGALTQEAPQQANDGVEEKSSEEEASDVKNKPKAPATPAK
jgi:hypothetical protein